MKPSEVKELIMARFKKAIKRPVHLVSSPGLGKTQVISQVAKELNIGCILIHAPLMQPEDYGFPVVSKDKTDVDFIVSKHKFPIEGSDCPEFGILGIDEVSQADNSQQKIIAQLVQEREIHGKKLKKGWTIVTTGNKTTDRAGANRLLSHFKDRLTEVDFECSLDDWTQWAITNEVPVELVSFIRFRPDLLSAFDAQAEKSPTPRSWVEGVGAALGVVDPASEFACFKGDVGEGAAAEFCAFLKIYRKLPSPDAIIMNPEGSEVPQEPSVLYALIGALSHKTTLNNFGRIMSYVNRLPKEFSVLYVKIVLKKVNDIQTTKEFCDWISGEGAKLLA